MNERNDDRLERIVGLLRTRVAACDQLIDASRGAGRRIDAGILMHRREEVKAILATVLEIVEANDTHEPRRDSGVVLDGSVGSLDGDA